MKNFSYIQKPQTLYDTAIALERRQITSEVLCVKILERYRKIDSVICGYVHMDEEHILATARASDHRRSLGKAKSRFDGLPIAIKDNISVQGQPCGCGSKILESYLSPYDATVIKKLKDKGFICLGRTNMDEFAMGSSTEYSAYLPTKNPWDIRCVPGGSSGGSAAVVASGEAIAALGSDTGGSIRQPAGFCGVVGLKPTYGRISRFGLVAFASSLDQIGPITSDVRDAAIILDIICGHDPCDNTSLPDVPESFERSLETYSIAGINIGVPRDLLDDHRLDSEVREALQQTILLYQDCGCNIVDISLPHHEYTVASYYIIATAEASSNLARYDGMRYGNRSSTKNQNLLATYLSTRKHGFGQEVKRRILLGTFVLSSGYYDAYYRKAQQVRSLIHQDFARAWARCDILLTPVAPTTAFTIGSITDPLQMYLSDVYTASVNLSGTCAVSIPVGMDSKGLPIGAQLIGAPLQEATILQAAHAVLDRKQSIFSNCT